MQSLVYASWKYTQWALVFVSTVFKTSFCSRLVPPLHQQVARTLWEEGQHTQLQYCWKCQEGEQVVPPGLLQSEHQQKNYIKASAMEPFQHIWRAHLIKQMSYSCYTTIHWRNECMHCMMHSLSFHSLSFTDVVSYLWFQKKAQRSVQVCKFFRCHGLKTLCEYSSNRCAMSVWVGSCQFL